MDSGTLPTIGVIIVTYRSADVIGECLTSLLDSEHPVFPIVVCDNGSPDDTVATIRAWAAAHNVAFAEYTASESDKLDYAAFATVTLLRSDLNGGYAAGVNIGLKALLPHREVDLFWILNPDCVVTSGVALAYAKRAKEVGEFALMGSRLLYFEPPHLIQSDGGRVSRLTGVVRNVNQGLSATALAAIDPGHIDFICGANILASRPFITHAGLMPEDYFLFYEEVEWALRRGDLPLYVCFDAIVYHHAGTSTGSAKAGKRASAFTNYFNFRSRIRFMKRVYPDGALTSRIYSLLKIAQLFSLCRWEEASGAFRGLFSLSPPAFMRIPIHKN